MAALHKVAKDEKADPREWRVSFAPVKMEDWLSIEIWNGEEWIVKAGKGGRVIMEGLNHMRY